MPFLFDCSFVMFFVALSLSVEEAKTRKRGTDIEMEDLSEIPVDHPHADPPAHPAAPSQNLSLLLLKR